MKTYREYLKRFGDDDEEDERVLQNGQILRVPMMLMDARSAGHDQHRVGDGRAEYIMRLSEAWKGNREGLGQRPDPQVERPEHDDPQDRAYHEYKTRLNNAWRRR